MSHIIEKHGFDFSCSRVGWFENGRSTPFNGEKNYGIMFRYQTKMTTQHNFIIHLPQDLNIFDNEKNPIRFLKNNRETDTLP